MSEQVGDQLKRVIDSWTILEVWCGRDISLSMERNDGADALMDECMHLSRMVKHLKFWEENESEEDYKARILADPDIDPHYKIMIKNGYKEVPSWWFGIVLCLSFFIGLGTLYAIGSTLPWWGYILSNIFAAIFILFFGAQYGKCRQTESSLFHVPRLTNSP